MENDFLSESPFYPAFESFVAITLRQNPKLDADTLPRLWKELRSEERKYFKTLHVNEGVHRENGDDKENEKTVSGLKVSVYFPTLKFTSSLSQVCP
jgi:hypothetical protein